MVIIYSFFLFNVSFVLGYFVLAKIQAKREDFLFNLSYSILLGYGILSYFVLFLSFFGPLEKLPIFIFVSVVLISGRRSLFYFYRNFKKFIINFFRQTSLNKILIGFLFFLALLAFLSVFMPPFRGDVIYYHLPEAIRITEGGILNFFGDNLNRHWADDFPHLMEVLYAIPILVNSFSLAHLIHYQIFLVGILAIYVFLRNKFGKTHGILACLLIFTLAELIINATTAYIDAAMVVFNIAGLLVFIDWFFLDEKKSLVLSAILFGFAASIKYLAFYNLLIVVFLLFLKIIFIDKKNFRQIIKTSLLFLGFWSVPAGFWYFKNLIFYLNPVYPFFNTMSISWKLLYPRTLIGFLNIPLSVFKEPYYYSVLFGFFVLPFIILIWKQDLIQKNKKLIIFLFVYLFSFFGLWFFVGSQVRRYSIDGQIVLMILVAIILGTILIKILEKTKLVWKIVLIVFASLPLLVGSVYYKDNYFIEIEKLQIEYLLGIKNKHDFYQFQNMGEGFLVSDYINKHFQNEKIINNLCAGPESFFLRNGNKFISLDEASIEKDEDLWPQLLSFLSINNINYLLVDWQKKQKHYKWRTGACTLDWQNYKTKILPMENLVKEHSEIIFSLNETDIRLYKINLE